MREFVKQVHFVGIGGIGMSGIAEVVKDLGYRVSGSDLRQGPVLDRLRQQGVAAYVGHQAANIKGADVVVVSSAVALDNPEVMAARELKIPVVPRAEMLGELMRFKQGVAIAGTHGKTTTTSLVSTVLITAGLDPTFVIGGVVNSERSNARLGKGEYMIAEADESDASFLQLAPQIAAVTNIDADHMGTYGNSFDVLKQTFVRFLHNLPFYGLAVLCFDDPVIRSIVKDVNRRIISYGFDNDVDVQARNMHQNGHYSEFEVIRFGESAGVFKLAMPGRHNVLNALVAIVIAHQLGIDDDDVRRALIEFKGIGRRFDRLGQIQHPQGEALLVDDYAHHPRELAATFEAAKAAYPEQRIVKLFQPHRYSRTQELFDDFAQVLSTVDNLVLLEVYPAGEHPITTADGRALATAIRLRGGQVTFVETFEQANQLLGVLLADNDVLLTLGAGDIGRFAHEVLSEGVASEAEAATSD